eukprot:gene15193-21267_t
MLYGIPAYILKNLYQWPPSSVELPPSVSASASRASLLLAGSYLKLKRGMPQTKWNDPKTGARIGGISLAERIEEEGGMMQSGAQMMHLQPCTRQAVEKIKEAEETKEKTPLNEDDVAKLLAVKGLEVQQDTPIRVLHRRAPKIRSKVVNIEKVEILKDRPNYFGLQLRTQAGTYIKEFCHGDFGRSQPCLGEIIGSTDRTEIVQLDVLAVHMENWP